MITRTLSALTLASMAATAYAAEESPSLTIQFSALEFSSSSLTQKEPDTPSSTSKVSRLETSSEDSYVGLSYRSWNFYVHPLAPNAPIGLSYSLSDAFEVGSMLEVAHIRSSDSAAKQSSTLLAPFASYSVDVGSATLEHTLGVELRQGELEQETDDGKATLKARSTGVSLEFGAVLPFAKSYAFVPGAKYTMTKGTEKFGSSAESVDDRAAIARAA